MPTARLSMRRIQPITGVALWSRGELAGDRAGTGHRTEHGAKCPGPSDGGGDPGWPLAADVTDESLVAQLFVNAGVRAGARFPRRAGLGGVSAGAQASRREPADFVGRVSGSSPERLRLQPVLPIVPRVRAAAVTHDAPTARGRPQVVRHLLRQTRTIVDPLYRRSSDGRDLCGCRPALPAAPTPRRHGRRRCRIGSGPMCVCSASMAQRPDCWFPTTSRAASTRPHSTTLR